MKLLDRVACPPHDSSATHVRGQSEFVDDRPMQAGELHVGVVFSPHAHARIARIDASPALAIEGVAAVFTASDLQHNRWGPIFQDQPLIADGEVNFVGEPVAIVAADSRAALEQGRRAVVVDYEPLPAVLSIAEARAQKSFIMGERVIARGDVDLAFQGAPHTLEGRLVIQGQDHFYLESHASIAYPRDGGQVEIHASSQHPTEVQHTVAHALGLPGHTVVCVVRRMGGGFGGKESQAAPFATFAALVAHRLNRAARVVLTKDDDMVMTGKRNPFENEWKVAFDAQGTLLALDVRLFSDGGAYADLSTSIMERAMLHSDNAYFVPAMRVTGQVCRTHMHPHTAFRGFGGPKGVALIEDIAERIARHLGLDPLDVRKRNVYRPGFEVTHYGQPIPNNLLPELLETLEARADYRARRAEIASFNETSSTHVRGLSLTAVKFGISFTTRFLNQGNALVNVHTDGTIQVSTGATEMGQGVNMRIAQTVARVFGVSHSAVRVMATSTEKNANTSPTAASAGTDLNARAAEDAALRIRSRIARIAAQVFELPAELRPSRTAGLGTRPELVDDVSITSDHVAFEGDYVFDARAPEKRLSFAELCREAYLSRIQLGEYGFFRIPNLHFDKLTGQGEPFFYFTQAVACSEVTIDRFTGELKVERVDLLADLGTPINQALDVGQVMGAFIQGMGWVTTENLVYEQGALISHSPSTYKIPNVQDTPRIFNVDLALNTGNGRNVGGGKAVGEPPLLLGISVWTAISDALHSASVLAGLPAQVDLPIPATLERILLALPRCSV